MCSERDRVPRGAVLQSRSVTNAFTVCHFHISRPFRERRLERKVATVWKKRRSQRSLGRQASSARDKMKISNAVFREKRMRERERVKGRERGGQKIQRQKGKFCVLA